MYPQGPYLGEQPTSVVLGRIPVAHNTSDLSELIPADVWTPAYDAHDELRDGAWVAELMGLLDMSKWPPGMRVVVRNRQAHPGAQLRITDVDGHRVTAFATNTDQDLQGHRVDEPAIRVRPELDLCAIVALAVEITAWIQMLTLNGPSQALGAKTVAAEPVHPPGHDRTHPPAGSASPRDQSPWVDLVNEGVRRLRALADPGLMSTHPSIDHRATPDHLDPAPTRDDTRATVTPK